MKEPPISPDAENGLIASILMEAPRVMPNCLSRGISAEHFYDLRNRKIYEIFEKMDFHKIDFVSVAEKLKEKAPGIPREYLLEISDTTMVSGYSESYMEIVAKTFRKRKLLEKLQEIENSVMESEAGNFDFLFGELQEIYNVSRENLPKIIDAVDWYENTPPEAEPLISGICDLGDKIQVVAASKMRKTYFTLQLALSIATGKPFLDWKIPKARKVLFLQFEIKAEHFHGRVHRVASAMHIDPDRLRGQLEIANMRGIDFSPEQIAPLVKQRKAELVIIDPLYKLIDGDENSAQDMKPILAVFDRVMQQTGAAVLYVHHDTKGKAGDKNIRDRGAGSGVIARDYDACITLTAHRDDENAAVVDTLLRNYAPRSPFVADFWDNQFSLSDLPAVAETSRNSRSRKQEISVSDAAIIEKSDCTMTEFRRRLIEELGLTDSNARKIIKDFPEAGKLERRKKAGSRETWIATPERMQQLLIDWKF